MLALIVGVLVTASLMCLFMGLGNMNGIVRRARQLSARAAVPATTPEKGATPEGWVPAFCVVLDNWLAALDLLGSHERRALALTLARAGLRQPHAVSLMQLAIMAAPALATLVGYAVTPLLVPDAALGVHIAGIMVALVAGVVAPRLWLSNRIRKRQQMLSAQLADAIDLYVICVDAGLSLDAAMARVARELGPAAPELADELQLTAIELGFLPNRHEAFSNLLRRVPLAEFRALVGMFQQTERYGTPLAVALARLSAEFRAEALLKAEEKAARLPALLTVPMIVFVLPPLFIVLLGPAILQLLAFQN